MRDDRFKVFLFYILVAINFLYYTIKKKEKKIWDSPYNRNEYYDDEMLRMHGWWLYNKLLPKISYIHSMIDTWNQHLSTLKSFYFFERVERCTLTILSNDFKNQTHPTSSIWHRVTQNKSPKIHVISQQKRKTIYFFPCRPHIFHSIIRF